MIGAFLADWQLIKRGRWGSKSHSPRTAWWLPVPAEPGGVDAEEAAGGPGEQWQCHQVLAKGPCMWISFFQIKNRIKNTDLNVFLINRTSSIAGTVAAATRCQSGLPHKLTNAPQWSTDTKTADVLYPPAVFNFRISTVGHKSATNCYTVCCCVTFFFFFSR